MLEYTVGRTNEFISSKLKATRKSSGQFFTSAATARFMAGLFTIPPQSVIKVLDPGAGSGILSTAVVEAINRHYPHIKEIELTCYETDFNVIPLLEANIEYIKNSSKIKITTMIIKKDYLLSQSDDFSGNFMVEAVPQKYDLIIGNPPYFKLAKDAPQAVSMPNVCYGTPNIYFLFAAMSLFNLREGGEMVYIIPRSWTSGAYFSRFRNYFLGSGKLTDIHTFTSRNKVFDKENVLQETMIIKVRKTNVTPSSVKITSSSDSNDFENITELFVPYDVVVSGAQQYVHLITSQDEADVLQKVNAFEKPLPSMGMKMKTGLTVDFRNKDFLRNTSGNHIVPLFYSQHIKGGRVIFPIGKENEYISDELSGMMQLNRNYLFVKRFTTKEERRRLQCAVYLANNYPDYKKISTQNKINFIDTTDGSSMSEKLVFGLYIVLNSTLYDKYYRILNGSTQVNATEINSIPMPNRKDLEHLGQRLMNCGDNTTAYCDKLLEEIIYA
jgi:adenine-specific DNA-methyltransferase